MSNKLLIAYYGDDFTGSTDALESVSMAGLRTALFMAPPTAAQLAKYGQLDAIGVAGLTRSMPPAMMEQTLSVAFKQLKALRPRHVHYKVCSTFDSAPHIGSIGKAIDTGAAIFHSLFVPLLVAAPSLGRYCVFGNLFARMGIGSNGEIHRLDRHPSMSKHPVTPADESDLRLHLSKQTSKRVGLLDILQVEKGLTAMQQTIDQLVQQQQEIILIDALYEAQLLAIGELIDSYTTRNTLFSVGSSGIGTALCQYWKQQQSLPPTPIWETPKQASPLLVIAGSCSPVTATQIAWAKENGFTELVMDTAEGFTAETIRAVADKAIALLQGGNSVIIHTNGAAKQSSQNIPAEQLGTALGSVARLVAATAPVTRIVIAGGDTSSYAARAMGIESIQMLAPLVSGAPLCKATAPGSPIDGLEINCKGGQVGAADYFGVLREGRKS